MPAGLEAPQPKQRLAGCGSSLRTWDIFPFRIEDRPIKRNPRPQVKKALPGAPKPKKKQNQEQANPRPRHKLRAWGNQKQERNRTKNQKQERNRTKKQKQERTNPRAGLKTGHYIPEKKAPAHRGERPLQNRCYTRATWARRVPRWRLRNSMRRSSARMAMPRAICFSLRLAKPRRNVLGSGVCT